MICPNCNQKIKAKDSVCHHCGLKLKLDVKPHDAWIATITPKFSFFYECVPTIQGLLIFIMTMIVGNLLCEYFNKSNIYVTYAVVVLLLIYVIGIIMRYLHKKMMKYDIYENRVVYTDDFIISRVYELNYENVIDVEYTESLLERIFSLGTIRIYADRSICKGLVIHHITNGRHLYRNMKQMIKESK